MKFRDMITLQRYRRLRTWTAAIALVGVGSAGTLLLQPAYLRAEDAAPPATSGKNGDTYKQLNLFGEVFEKVRAEYVEPVTDETLIENSINGMLSSLDPHSSYLNAKNYKDMQVQTRGEFGGLGIEVTLDNGVVKVVSPIDDTPASRAGVKPGDLIIQINSEPVSGLSLNEAVEKMRGPVNSDIKLMLKREGKDPFDVTLTRAIIKIDSVKAELKGDIAYIRISSFSEQTDSGLNKLFQKVKDEAGGKLRGVVLDLRNDPGGLLDQAIQVSDAFLEKGEIVSTRGRRAEETQRFNARPGDITGGLPVVVLINGGSASASEIVAGALQDHHRAIVLGTKSFGKGSVQTIMPLPGHGAIRLTTARYFTPSGRSIQAVGIEPDIIVPAAKLEVLDEGQFRHEADLKGALKNPNNPKAGAATKPTDAKPSDAAPATGAEGKPSTDAGATAAPVVASITSPDDYQLARAIDLLHGITLYTSRASD
jgi:carboxyl-terminal processing protease